MLQRVMTFILNVLRWRDAEKPKELEETPPISTPTPETIESKVEPVLPTPPEPPKKRFLEKDQEEKLSRLYPPFAEKVREFVLQARDAGMAVGIFEGLRTVERQQELYAKGRDQAGKVIDKTKVVTNAPPGSSFHNYGLAVDLVFDGDEVRPGWQWSWSNQHPWRKLAEMGRSLSLEAAYFWRTFPEAAHFQMTYGFKHTELLALYHEGGLKRVWEEIDSFRKTRSSRYKG